MLVANPRFLQAGAGVSALVSGPFYLVLIYAFVKGRDWIRLPATSTPEWSRGQRFSCSLLGSPAMHRCSTVCGAAYTL
jgi:hypothetical protein